MAHIHLPEGTLPLLWVAVWWISAIVLIAIGVYWLRSVKRIDNRAITMAGLLTAAAFAIFQVEIPIFGGVHMNLTPLIGILAGPAAGGIVVLIVNVLSAAIGHGGWGLIGANTLVNVVEVLVAYFVYVMLGRFGLGAFSRAGIATLLGLFLGNVAMVLIILISGIQGVTQDIVSVFYGLTVIAGINMAVAIIEAVVTGYVVAYLARVRPDMLQGRGLRAVKSE